MNKREEIIEKAKQIVTKDRNNCYGEPENNFKEIAEFWNTYLTPHNMQIAITSSDVAIMMCLLKIARISTSFKTIEDNWVDAIGYMACSWENVDNF